MGRRLVDATNACLTRRTRGETALCFLLALEAAFFRLAGACLDSGVVEAWVEDLVTGFLVTVLLAGEL
jgi:hypothetical protein